MERRKEGEREEGKEEGSKEGTERGGKGIGALLKAVTSARGEGAWPWGRGLGRRARTGADQSCVLAVVAVAPAPGASGTVPQRLLPASAPHVVHPHGPCARAEPGPAGGGQRAPAAQLAAGHGGVPQVPAVVAHGAPAPAVPHLQAAGAPVGAGDQAQPLWRAGGERGSQGPRGRQLGIRGFKPRGGQWPEMGLPAGC